MPKEMHQYSRVLQDEASCLEAIEHISCILDRMEGIDNSLDKILSIISGNVCAEGATIYAKQYETKGNFYLKCIGSWHSSTSECDILKSFCDFNGADLENDEWDVLENNKIVELSNNAPKTSNYDFNKYACPLFLNGNLFGFLLLTMKDSILGEGVEKAFIRAVCRILDLWIGKANESHYLKTLLNLLPSPAYAINTEHTVTMWNKAMEAMTGRAEDDILGKSKYAHGQVFHEWERPTSCDLILDPDSIWEKEYRDFVWKSNELYTSCFCPGLPDGGAYLTGKTALIRDMSQRVVGSIHVVRDATRERRMEKDLEQSQQMYKTLTDFAGVGIALFGRESTIYCNEKLNSFLGIEGKILTRDAVLDRILPEDRQLIADHFEAILDGSTETIRTDVRSVGGKEPTYYQAYAQLVYFDEKPTIHFILDDITDQKRLAEQARLNELKLYHEDRLTALGVMAAGISHELNQPLTAIKVISEGLLFGREKNWLLDESVLFSKMEMISQQTARMVQVVKNVRDFAREDSRETPREIDVNIAIENVFSMLGRQLKVHGIEVEFCLSPTLPKIFTALNHLEQIIMNLVVNARQALDECSSEDKIIEIRSFEREGFVAIEIADNAGGISPGIISKIFDPFFTTKEVGQGTGLGLSISQSIAAKFKGHIEAFNNKRNGATFILVAPIEGT